jgi:hypothetical protein
MQPVDFPADAREDIKLFGIVEMAHLKYIAPAIVFVMVSFLIPIPIQAKLFFMVAVPLFLILFLSLGVGKFTKKRKRFVGQSALRLAKQSKTDDNIQSLISVVSIDEPYIIMQDKSISVLIQLTPTSWHVNTDSSRQYAVDIWQSVLRRASQAGVSVSAYCDFLPHLPRQEWANHETMALALLPGLCAVSQARLRTFRELARVGQAREWCYVLRLACDPREMSFSRRPKNSDERAHLARKSLLTLTGEVQAALAGTGASAMLLGAEAARDVLSRQISPAKYQGFSPVRSTVWEIPETPEESTRAEPVPIPIPATPAEAEGTARPQLHRETRPREARSLPKVHISGGFPLALPRFLGRAIRKMYRHYVSERGMRFILFVDFTNARLRNSLLQQLYDAYEQVELLTGDVSINLNHDNLLVLFPFSGPSVHPKSIIDSIRKQARRNFVKLDAGMIDENQNFYKVV